MVHESFLITGIGGFVGRHLTALLRETGASVTGTVLPGETAVEGTECVQCRMEDQACVDNVVRSADPTVVFHLAAQSSVPRSLSDPRGTFEANVVGTLNLLEALRNRPSVRSLVLVISSEVYGIVPESELPVSEEARIQPVNPYACTKACADLLGEQYFSTFGVPVVRLRPFNHMGPGQSEAFAASSFARQIAKIEAGKKPPEIQVGNLDARRDFTDVRDIVRAYVLAVEKCSPGEVYNICSSKTVGMREILDHLLFLSSAEVKIVPDPERMRPSDMPVIMGDGSKFEAATGWRPEIPLDRTLNDLLDYWRGQV